MDSHIGNIPFKSGYILAESIYLKYENTDLYRAVSGSWNKIWCQHKVLIGRKHFAKIWKNMDINLKIKWSNAAINQQEHGSRKEFLEHDAREWDSLIAEMNIE